MMVILIIIYINIVNIIGLAELHGLSGKQTLLCPTHGITGTINCP